jgi:hypothetical protein
VYLYVHMYLYMEVKTPAKHMCYMAAATVAAFVEPNSIYQCCGYTSMKRALCPVPCVRHCFVKPQGKK